MIERTFQDIPEGKLTEADQQSFLVELGWSSGLTWKDLLRSRRVLMISEAGAGKTYECREQTKRLCAAGELAFFIELAALATDDIRSQLDNDEEARLDAWLSSQSDVATFFLDSIDELKLTLRSFEQALKCLKKGIGGQLGRARIIVTTRPTAFDERLLRQILPVPPVSTSMPNEEAFVIAAMGGQPTQQAGDEEDTASDWRTIALIPLSDAQIAEFAEDQGVDDSAALLEDLRKRNAQEFARRPQDLIELCADWRDHKRIRTHRDQVAANVRVKLQPRDDRPEPAELSVDRAIEGASRLALAMLVMRRMTIRHSAASDVMEDGAALDPANILSDWNPNERKALLERPLFGFASYGRVRFHHRSVAEYLAAERLKVLRGRGVPVRALKRLLFAQTRGKTIVRPSRRPIAGWLALSEVSIFEMLRDHEPAVLLNEGDPESLSLPQRSQALRAYVERFGQGGWRRLRVPDIQVRRFASPELADEIGALWRAGIENPDVRLTLLGLVESGRIGECADIADRVARDPEASTVERISAIDALTAIGDPRLEEIVSAVAADALWPDDLVHLVVLRLFPRNLSIEQLCQVLGRLTEKRRGGGDLNWHLPHLIAKAGFDLPHLEALRDGLVELLSDGLSWLEEQTSLDCRRAHLSGALAATCALGLDGGKTDNWLHAAVLALRLHHRSFTNDEPKKALRERLTDLTAEENARLFWAEDSLVQSLRPIADPWQRFAEVALNEGPVELRVDRDLDWIKDALGDTARSTDDRAMLLEAAMRLPPNWEERSAHVSGLRPLVADQPGLIAAIDNRLKPSKYDEQHERWEKKAADEKKQRERRVAKTKAKWVQFWREVAERPDSAFSSERSLDTAWNLWRAMSHAGEHSRASGWNRRFIEEQFGTETADRLRRTLMTIWREDCPTLASERQEDRRNILLVRWQLGLAGLYAEAEDPSWATKLSDDEAKLAARYAPVELNALPRWMEDLVDAHPAAVDAILGNELSLELNTEPVANGHSKLLQDIDYAPEPVARKFLPRLGEWLDRIGNAVDLAGDLGAVAERHRQVIHAMLKHGGEDTRAHVRAAALQCLENDLPEELALVWLPTLMQVDPVPGVSALEDRIRSVAPAARSEAVKWFSVLFGDHRDAINLKNPEFSPQLLLRLLRLAYRHIRIADDAHHEDAYTPDTRDNAETARSMIVNALLEAKGEEGWMAKLEMANDPLCAHFKHRILAVAEEQWAQEIDSVAFDEQQALALDKKGEAPASTNEAMFAIMNDRLDDLDDLLLTDASPREVWANITDEKLLRREIARALRDTANGLYTVDQEAVTADENKTDIRLRSVASAHEAVIELKRADGRSGRNLSDAIFHQLVTKYMAAETRKSGCLLVALAKNRTWTHPESDQELDASGLVSLLRDETVRVVEKMGGAVRLSIHLLDLRPR